MGCCINNHSGIFISTSSQAILQTPKVSSFTCAVFKTWRVIAITAILKLCPPFCDKLHYHYVITIHLYKLAVNVDGRIYGSALKTDSRYIMGQSSQCRYYGTSTYPIWLTDSNAICCMLSVLYMLHPILKQNTWLALNLPSMELYFWTCFVYRIENTSWKHQALILGHKQTDGQAEHKETCSVNLSLVI
jgi:hypothetical protein